MLPLYPTWNLGFVTALVTIDASEMLEFKAMTLTNRGAAMTGGVFLNQHGRQALFGTSCSVTKNV